MKPRVQPLIFLHIPKTAGVTLHYILRNQYFLKRIYNIYSLPGTQMFIDLPDKTKLKYKVINGHMHFGLHKHIPVPVAYFTFLREPYARTISGFNFIKQYRSHPYHKEIVEKKYSLKEFLNLKLVKNFDNMHVRFLAGANDLPFGEVDETVFNKAKENFDSYFKVFGIVERFDESILFIKEEFNWSNPYYVRENQSPQKNDMNDFDEETVELIRKYNYYDKQLYDYACVKFDTIIKQRGSGFQDKVKKFQYWNKWWMPCLRLFNRYAYKAPLNQN
jgi:hypothetical protein